jgi:adenine-specific DNA-methyltransferase
MFQDVTTYLANFKSLPLKDAARQLLATLGYKSNKFIAGIGSEPQDFLAYFDTGNTLKQDKALVEEWKSADLLFQLTDQELSRASSLFTDESVQRGLLKSYVFIAIELRGSEYARSKFSAIARQINWLFPMPVMVMFKHGDRLTIAVINRRRNKLDDSKDVLEKATLIRDIKFAEPHRGHLDILASLALPRLVHPQKKPITDFDTLHAAWEQIFNVELLNERFYRELANWYFWALPQVEFPSDLEPDAEKRNATGLIRLLTRLIFCWFLKEKGLIPDRLFHPADLAKILKGFDPESETSSTFYHAILQNLFFATLNQRMGKDSKGNSYRVFAKDEGFPKNKATYDINNLYRYENLFAVSEDEALALFSDIPFLNGGLFECLDRTEDGTNKKRYLDGFSRNPKKRPHLPDRLFFDSGETADLSAAYGDKKRKAESVIGLISILNRYKFTIVENTPIDQEIALDPELLGKVFENLLASYNEETKTTARKQTGSFYTPRPIVDYMVDESLKAHLARALVEKADMNEADARAGLDILFAYTEKEHAFTASEVAALIAAIDDVKILDPACGSGAFPMGVLHKLVYLLSKLDPENVAWERLQIAKVQEFTDTEERRQKLSEIVSNFAENNDDYGRKLYLIENCLYGVDIQPIAIQISKLRFFISLVCDQRTNNDESDNLGVRPLPNLETKFVAADTLIGLPIELSAATTDVFVQQYIEPLEQEIAAEYHKHFSIQNRAHKLDVQRRIKELRSAIAAEIIDKAGIKGNAEIVRKAQAIASWDPFDPQSTANFFDPQWMFGGRVKNGFDVMIGNPPYVQIQKFSAAQKDKWVEQKFATYSATADIYCLFYEKGLQLLAPGGRLCYITSNKWMRAGYGEALRGYLATRANTTDVLDFGMAQNFGAATTYTCIVQVTNESSMRHTRACYASDDHAAMSDPAGYFASNYVVQTQLGTAPWVVLPSDRQRIKTMVEDQGVPLEIWDVEINYGIKTGFNDAFYITQEQRDAFIAEDLSCEKLLVPLLRGRFVERYGHSWDGTWMINSHNGLKERNVPPVDLKRESPVLWRHVAEHEKELSKRQDKGDHWSNLRNCAYIEEFTKPKIIYPNMTKYLPFFCDRGNKFFTNDKGFILTSETQSLTYLTAFLNSHLFRCCFRDNFPELTGNTYEVRKIFVEKIPVKKPTAGQAALFEKLVPLVQLAKEIDEKIPGAFLEDLIDACVMECYFHDHMAERDLLFHATLAPHLANYDPEASEAKQREFLADLHLTLNAPTSKIRNRLLRLTADSPDLLAIIKAEGRV